MPEKETESWAEIGKAQKVHSQELASQRVLLEGGCGQQGQMLWGAWVTEGLGSVR